MSERIAHIMHTHQMQKHRMQATNPATARDSRYFFLWMPSISLEKEGTLAGREANTGTDTGDE